MDETLDVRLPPWFAISNSALKSNSLKNFYWNLIKLYLTQNGCGNVCVPYTSWPPIWRRLLSRDSLPIMTNVLYEQLLSSVPYATLCPICNGIFMIFVYWTIHQLCQKLTFFFKFNKFQPLKLFFRDFTLSASLV